MLILFIIAVSFTILTNVIYNIDDPYNKEYLKEELSYLEEELKTLDYKSQADNSYYLDLRHKSLIKYADKIITINRPDRTATEKEIRDGLIEKGVAEIRIDKDLEEYYSPWINLKFDNNALTFNEIPKTPWFIATILV